MLAIYIDNICKDIGESIIEKLCTDSLNYYFDIYTFYSESYTIENNYHSWWLKPYKDIIDNVIMNLYWDIYNALIWTYPFGTIFNIDIKYLRNGLILFIKHYTQINSEVLYYDRV